MFCKIWNNYRILIHWHNIWQHACEPVINHINTCKLIVRYTQFYYWWKYKYSTSLSLFVVQWVNWLRPCRIWNTHINHSNKERKSFNLLHILDILGMVFLNQFFYKGFPNITWNLSATFLDDNIFYIHNIYYCCYYYVWSISSLFELIHAIFSNQNVLTSNNLIMIWFWISDFHYFVLFSIS